MPWTCIDAMNRPTRTAFVGFGIVLGVVLVGAVWTWIEWPAMTPQETEAYDRCLASPTVVRARCAAAVRISRGYKNNPPATVGGVP
jgi:hypothetical protein